jgi:hypothetical protein
MICSIETKEGVLTEQKDVSKHIVDFYKGLFGSPITNNVHLESGFYPMEEQLGAAEKVLLNLPFSENDVLKTINGMKSDSAPGPNGFTAMFFKKLWVYAKNGMKRMVEDFNRNNLDLKRLNFGMITLVPKVLEANTIKKYRPICLLNVDFKVFPKLLNDRLTSIAGNIVSDSQTAFIKGRNILEGVVTLHEVLYELKRTKNQGVLFKINFEKAYDKVKWNFVREVMERKGFPPSWIEQTMSTIQGGEVCVNVNGERSQYFRTYQGL